VWWRSQKKDYRKETLTVSGSASCTKIARVKFLPGKLEEWKRLTAEAMHIVRTKDKGTLQYDLPVLAMPPA